MVSILGADNIMEYLISFFATVAEIVTIDYVLYGVLGLFAAFLIYGIVRVCLAYELRSLRAIKKINKYLIKNPQVKDTTLIDFNGQMRKLPKRMRERWQLYMLERDGVPSKYMTGEHCVERPLRYSSIKQFLRQFKYGVALVGIVSFLLATGFAASGLGEALSVTLLKIAVIPLMFVVLCFLFCVIIEARYSFVTSDLSDNFAIFMRNVDKSTITMPDYVDYELLFTKQEIREGIPVLREYLEKRALEEQRLIEEAKKNAVEHSPYNFDELGINGALLLERAVHESEAFLLTRIRLQNEINDLHKDMEKSKRTFEDTEKEGQRKLQTIRENLDRLKKQADESTNRIEVNYIRKQEAEEVKKQTYIERDLEEYRKRAEEEQRNVTIEIQRRKETIDSQRAGIEVALKAEYNTFATKVYAELNKKMSEDHAETVQGYEDTLAKYKAKVKELAQESDRMESVIEARNLEIDNMRMTGKGNRDKGQNDSGRAPRVSDGSNGNEGYNAVTDKLNYEPAPAAYSYEPEPVAFSPPGASQEPEPVNLINSAAKQSVEEVVDYSQYYDENGNLIDFTAGEAEGSNVEADDYSQYYDENGNLIDYSRFYDENGNYIGESTAAQEPEEVIVPQVVAEAPKPEIKKPAAKPKAATAKKTRVSTAQKKAMPSATGRRLTSNEATGASKKLGSEMNDLLKLQKQIEKQSSDLVKQQQELRNQISNTLTDIDKDDSISKAERNKYLKQIKTLIEDLKVQAQEAKDRGAPKSEQNAINKSIMELLNAIAKYSG
ncbi:MAG: hypothetical protein FWE53_00835 [Firmicutes bacterium]|nr:hypothetical protein [Bacillota bacterium]